MESQSKGLLKARTYGLNVTKVMVQIGIWKKKDLLLARHRSQREQQGTPVK